jgi:hypothetical protein
VDHSKNWPFNTIFGTPLQEPQCLLQILKTTKIGPQLPVMQGLE